MGLAESKLTIGHSRPLVRPDLPSQLPSFSLDSAVFSGDGKAIGFVVTRVDLAKNSTTVTVPVKFCYRPSENSLVYVGSDESILTFTKDYNSGKVICRVEIAGQPPVVRVCVTNYEPIDEKSLDYIGDLYKAILPVN